MQVSDLGTQLGDVIGITPCRTLMSHISSPNALYMRSEQIPSQLEYELLETPPTEVGSLTTLPPVSSINRCIFKKINLPASESSAFTKTD